MTGENFTIFIAEKTTSKFHQMQYKKILQVSNGTDEKVVKRKTQKRFKKIFYFCFKGQG